MDEMNYVVQDLQKESSHIQLRPPLLYLLSTCDQISEDTLMPRVNWADGSPNLVIANVCDELKD